MKSLGVPSRGRVFEISKSIKYIKAKPRMELYVSKSKEVVSIFLDFVSKEDMHVYSIDESFLDVTDYLKLYKLSDYDLALKIMNTIKEKTGLTSTCGIGPNLFLAKVALDTESKHNKNCIAKWTYDDVKNKLWKLEPLTEMWGIGSKTMRKLNDLGVKCVGDINKYSINFYKKRFGVLGEEIYLHANGIDTSNIKEKCESKNKSYSVSQILFKDYTIFNVTLIIREMCSTLAKRLREKKQVCKLVGFGIGYSKAVGGGFYHSGKLSNDTNNEKDIYEACISIFNNYVDDLPIRKVSISLSKISNDIYHQLSIFSDNQDKEDLEKVNSVVDEINNKFGSNSLLKATSLMDYSTIRKRNNTLGGHSK